MKSTDGGVPILTVGEPGDVPVEDPRERGPWRWSCKLCGEACEGTEGEDDGWCPSCRDDFFGEDREILVSIIDAEDVDGAVAAYRQVWVRARVRARVRLLDSDGVLGVCPVGDGGDGNS